MPGSKLICNDWKHFVDNEDDDNTRSELPQSSGEEALSLSDFYVSGMGPDYSDTLLRPHSLADLYDNILELQDEICNDDSIEDLFNVEHSEHRDTWDLFNALVCLHVLLHMCRRCLFQTTFLERKI